MRVLRQLLVLVLVLAIGAAALAASITAFVPGVRTIARASEASPTDVGNLSPLAQRTTVYAADGSVLDRLGIENRDPASLSLVPQVMIDAVIAVEDQSFYTNPGFDLQATMRAFITNLTEGKVEQGGSTITQQLVKNRILTPKRDVERKMKEISLAWRLSQQYTKNEVLEEYLNTVYFGQGSYGIASAAERFFDGRRLQDLTLEEAALLAGVIRNPEGDNPFVYPEKAQKRRRDVLELMRKRGIITVEQEKAANAAPLPTKQPPAELRPDNYFVEEVQKRLLADERLGSDANERYNKVLRGGLRVYTTYDATAIAVARDSIFEILPDQPPFTAALASIDPTNGHVRALAQGIDYAESKYDITTHYPGRQTGSTFKAIVLSAAIENGFSPNDSIDGSSPCTIAIPGYSVWNTANAEPSSGGVASLRSQTKNSVNCAFARLIAAVGVPKVAEMAARLGVSQDVKELPSIALGAQEMTPLEMATVFATLAAEGVRHDPVFITRVEDAEGNLLFEADTEGKRVLDPEVARTVTDMLRGVITGGTGTRAQLDDGRVAAGKTGTTDERGDAWFCGFVPQLAACVWMGDWTARTPMRSVGGISVFGGTYPARIWKAFMDRMLAGQPLLDFVAPDQSRWSAGKYISGSGRSSSSTTQPQSSTTTAPKASTLPTTPSTTPTTPPAPSTTAPATTTTAATTTTTIIAPTTT